MSFFFFKQKTAYEMRISDWSSDVCSSDLTAPHRQEPAWILSILWLSACTSMRGIKVFDINVAVAGDRGRSSTGSQISSTGHEQDTRFPYNQPVRNEKPTEPKKNAKVVTAMTCHAIPQRFTQNAKQWG